MQRYEPKFLVDFMLGRLAKWLRALGYDAHYCRDKNKSNLLLQSLKENRILVSRDHGLSRKKAWRLILINSDHLGEQLRQLVDEAGVEVHKEKFFTRCTVCNSPLFAVDDKRSIRELVPDYVYQNQDGFFRCPHCGKVYWKGTHADLFLKDLIKAGLRADGL